jgi:hypothetical protein
VCFDSLCIFCLKNFSLQEEISEMLQIYVGLHIKCSLFLSDLNEILIFFMDFQKLHRCEIS